MKSKRVVQQSVLVLLLVALSTSCASKTGRPSSASETSGAAPSAVITMAELIRVASGQSVWTAIERARPWFLLGRGSVPRVSIDGSAPMELTVLRSMPVAEVHEVRLLRGGSGNYSAVLPNGDVVVGDVILVITRTR